MTENNTPAAVGGAVPPLVQFSDSFTGTAKSKLEFLQGMGGRVVALVLEDCDGMTATIDRWGRTTWGEKPNARPHAEAVADSVQADVGPTFSLGKYRGYVCDRCGEELPNETSRDVHYRRAQRGLGCQANAEGQPRRKAT